MQTQNVQNAQGSTVNNMNESNMNVYIGFVSETEIA